VSGEGKVQMTKKKAKSITLPFETAEARRFEVLLEEIRGELKLVAEAYTASVERDEKLANKIDHLVKGDEQLEARIDRVHRDFFEFVKNVHAELSDQIQSVVKRLGGQIQEVDGRLGRLEGKVQEVETRLEGKIHEVEQNIRKEIHEVKEILSVHEVRLTALEKV
jgi:hypothetical protein